MKKLISYLLVLVMMLSLGSTFAYAAETVKEEKEPLEIEEGKYIYPYIIEVEIFKEFSFEALNESFGVDFFSGYVPEGMELDYVELWDYDGSNATVRIDVVPDGTMANAINLAMAIHEHPKVKSVNFIYADKPVNPEDETKISYEIDEKYLYPNEISVLIFKCFSGESFDINSFKKYIPSDVEVEDTVSRMDFGKTAFLIIKLKKEYQTVENAVKLAQSIQKHPKVKVAAPNYYAIIDDPIVTETETESESESETVLDTIESAVAEDTGKVTAKAEETGFESESETETEAVASVGNNNKQTGDGLFIYVTLALLVSSVASTVVILKKGKRKED